jgi:hypothetical protein
VDMDRAARLRSTLDRGDVNKRACRCLASARCYGSLAFADDGGGGPDERGGDRRVLTGARAVVKRQHDGAKRTAAA